MQSVSNQFETDKKVVELAQRLENSFDFVLDTHALPNKMRLLESHIIKLLHTVSECCHFLQEYMQKGFLGMLPFLCGDQNSDIDFRENTDTRCDSTNRHVYADCARAYG